MLLILLKTFGLKSLLIKEWSNCPIWERQLECNQLCKAQTVRKLAVNLLQAKFALPNIMTVVSGGKREVISDGNLTKLRHYAFKLQKIRRIMCPMFLFSFQSFFSDLLPPSKHTERKISVWYPYIRSLFFQLYIHIGAQYVSYWGIIKNGPPSVVSNPSPIITFSGFISCFRTLCIPTVTGNEEQGMKTPNVITPNNTCK